MYKRQAQVRDIFDAAMGNARDVSKPRGRVAAPMTRQYPRRPWRCLLYTSDAADERSSVDLGGRRIIKQKTHTHNTTQHKHLQSNESTHQTGT